MNRPQKKKNQDPLLPEESNVVDERNLIDTEESVELTIEDKVALYWMENKGFIIMSFIALAAVLVGINGVKMYGESAQKKLQAAYAEARSSETLDQFAQANADKELGGFAALTVADEAYNAEEFGKAQEYYGIAANALEGNILAGRAQLGVAFAQYNGDDTEQAIATLNAIAADTKLANAVRAEAAYHLAVDAYAAGNTDAFDSYVAQIETTDQSGQWQQRINYYIQQSL